MAYSTPIARPTGSRLGHSEAELRSSASVLATGDDHGGVCIWRLDRSEPGCEMLTRSSDGTSLMAFRFSDDGKWLAAIDQTRTRAGNRATVILWRGSNSGRFVQADRLVFERELRDLDFAPNGTTLYLEGTNGFASLYPLRGGRRTDLEGHTATIVRHAFTRNAAWLFTGDNSGHVNAWDLSCRVGPPRPNALREHEAAIEDLQLTPDDGS